MERYQSRYGGPTIRTGKHSESGRANIDEKAPEMSVKIKLGLLTQKLTPSQNSNTQRHEGTADEAGGRDLVSVTMA